MAGPVPRNAPHFASLSVFASLFVDFSPDLSGSKDRK
jgi:hypothetical protein